MTSIQLNATISSRYLRKGISHRRHFDVAAMTMIFQKNIKFFTISILRRDDIDKLNATISSRYLRKGISHRRHFDVAAMTMIFQKISNFLRYRFCVVMTSINLMRRYRHDIFAKEYPIVVISMLL